MTRLKILTAALAASTLLAGAAVAADQSGSTGSPSTSPHAASQMSQQQASTDAGKLSNDGIAAYRDVHLARIAIFEAKPDQARMFVSHAQAMLDKARNDATAFSKAEADLKPPAGMSTGATMTGTDSASKSQMDKSQAGAGDRNGGGANQSASNQSVKWLPVDAQLVLADDFVARDKEQSKAIDEANQHLKTGDQKSAMDRLKLAGIDVDFTLAVVPLDKTVQGVDDAAKLIKDGKYYEANAALKAVEDGVRLDVVDVTAMPKGAAHSHDGGKTDATGTTKKAH